MIKRIVCCVVLSALLCVLGACVRLDDGGEAVYYSFSDSIGEKVTLAVKPQKVAVLFSSFADIWVTAGGSIDITVGEAVERGFAKETAMLVDGGAGKTVDTEALIAAHPDFVICSADIEAQKNAALLLKSAGIPCACFRVECFSDYLAVLGICTDITGCKDAYQVYGLDVAARIDDILSLTGSSTDRAKILFIRSGSGASSAKAKTARQHFAAQMLSELGAYNIADNAEILLDGLSIEEILRENPDYIFISTMGDEEAAKAYMDSVLASAPWQELTAVKKGRYVYLPKELFQFKPNARWDEAYSYLAELLGELN